jgi:tetratricopeptide (TPR) repeat protein
MSIDESGLFELIKTLSKTEKRYFKKYSGLHNSVKHHSHASLLFDAFEKMPEYDHDKFKAQNKSKPFYKNLASEKQHLMKIILQSLNEYHRNNNKKTTIQFHLNTFELLFQKRQYKIAEKHLVKALQLSYDSENTMYVFEIYKALGKLYQHSGNLEKLKQMLDKVKHEEKELFTSIEKEFKLKMIEFKSYYVSRKIGYPRTKKAHSEYEELLKSSSSIARKNPSFKEKLSLLTIKNFYYDSFPDKTPLMKIREEWIKLAEANEKYLADNSMPYLVSLNNLVNSYDELGMHNEVEKTLEKIIKHPYKNLDEEVRTFIYYYNLKLTSLINAGSFDQCLTLFPLAENGLNKFGRWFHPEYKLSFRYLFSYGYFGAQKFQQALKWANAIIINYPNETLEEFYNFARIFILLIYFELGYDGLLASDLRSANRYFNKQKKLFALEKTILDFMKTALKPEGVGATKTEFIELKRKIKELKNSPFEQQLFNLFDWESWVDSKIQNTSFEKIMKEKNQKQRAGN